ncbi:MAG TPA: HAMP domain-containing sensor histidine kinase [Thermoanaerobaculia bacterium]|jgi:signal transduction histidine kinase|nr:HAMP domain-containing sensor histidine kinase [Thermoanaerobaculia bacterium]
MRLADFILENVEPILTEWEQFARSLAPGSAMAVIALRDHAEDILRVTARDMASSQTDEQQADKSKGRGGGGTESARLDYASNEHALDRLGSGFNLLEVVSEYRALRASVLQLWGRSVRSADGDDLRDLIRFNESMDQSLAEAVKSYTQRVDESRELFLATLGHDLRNPLNAIVVSAGLLAGAGQLDEENTQIASQMSGFANVMAGMIDDLLDFTRTRLGGGMPVSPARTDLEHLCREVLLEFRAAHPHRPLRFESSGDTTGEWDASRLRQVASNLVANAIQYGDDATPVEVFARGEESDVLLAVKNEGPSISSSALPTIFDPFFRAAEVATKHRAGVGLGLYIARQIVIAHGGTIEVTSKETTGTVFTVRLPRRRSTADSESDPQ